MLFLSTPSARRATILPCNTTGVHDISIHALREEGDHALLYRDWENGRFLSTPSARRATCRRPATGKTNNEFLSTPSARRATSFALTLSAPAWNFYPRPPRGGRRSGEKGRFLPLYFYPRPPRGGRPLKIEQKHSPELHFYPRPPRGGRQPQDGSVLRRYTISIHALREEGDLERRA